MCLFTGTLYGIYKRKEKPARISKCRATVDMVSMWYLLCLFWMASLGLSTLQELVMELQPAMLQSMGSQRVGHN